MENQTQTPNPVTPNPAPVSSQTVYAGFWIRLAAYVIDVIIFGIPCFIISFIILALLGINGTAKSGENLIYVIFAVFWLPINLFFVTKFGATPGKMFYGLKIIKENMAPPKLLTAFVREVLGKIASSMLINLGYIWAGFDGQKQAWHDKIAGTHVIMTKPVRGFKKFSIYLIGIFPLLLVPLALFAAIALIAINPAKQFAQANDIKRMSDVNAIENAVQQYKVDNNGSIPPEITTSSQTIGSGGADLCSALLGKYLAAIPVDPSIKTSAPTSCGSAYDTGYTIFQLPNGSVTVSAPQGELNRNISITR